MKLHVNFKVDFPINGFHTGGTFGDTSMFSISAYSTVKPYQNCLVCSSRVSSHGKFTCKCLSAHFTNNFPISVKLWCCVYYFLESQQTTTKTLSHFVTKSLTTKSNARLSIWFWKERLFLDLKSQLSHISNISSCFSFLWSPRWRTRAGNYFFFVIIWKIIY